MYLKIKCGVCGQKWNIYSRDNWKDDRARQCPHCFAEIDRTIWNKDIIPGFCSMIDAEHDLINEHTGYNKPIFTIEVKTGVAYNEMPGYLQDN